MLLANFRTSDATYGSPGDVIGSTVWVVARRRALLRARAQIGATDREGHNRAREGARGTPRGARGEAREGEDGR